MGVMLGVEEQVFILLTSWPTVAMSAQEMGMGVAAVFTEACGAMMTGDWVTVVAEA